ncbi:MAG: hypothetical protein ACOYBY_02460 [Dermatophilaceae bacterium]
MRLRIGEAAPRQQSPVTCGATVLTVARALVDPAFDRWLAGDDTVPGPAPAGSTPQARLAAYEAMVHRRTTSVRGPGGRLQPPWPRALGTPPWGAKAELEAGAAAAGSRYRVRMLRPAGRQERRRAVLRLATVVAPGAPAVLYVGSAGMPRHVALVVPAGSGLAVYDPGFGVVQPLRADDLLANRLDVGGWPVPWFVVEPARG